MEDFGSVAGNLRSRTSALIREGQEALAADLTTAIVDLRDALNDEDRHGCAELLLRLFAASVDGGAIDTQSAAMRDLGRYFPPLSTRQLLDSVHHAERIILDEVALTSGSAPPRSPGRWSPTPSAAPPVRSRRARRADCRARRGRQPGDR
jgi:hypothetical protein